MQLAPYNDYRELREVPAGDGVRSDLGRRRGRSRGLKDLYGSVDRIELYPGLFAEDARDELGAARR